MPFLPVSQLNTIREQDVNGLPTKGIRDNIPSGRRKIMVDGKRVKKGQVGIWLSPSARMALINTSNCTGLTMSMVMELALKEYIFNHKDELNFYDVLMNRKSGNF